MKRSLSGLLPLAALAALASCGDPTSSLQGGPSGINAIPSAMVVNVGSAKTVDIQLVDKQGNPLAASFAVAIGDASVVDVVQDTSFRPGLGNDRLTQRYIVTALTPGYTQVSFTSGGVTQDVPVFGYPLTLPAAFSSATPNVNDVVTVTAPGFKFLPSATVTFGGHAMIIAAIAADSSSVSFRAGESGAGAVTVGGSVLGDPDQHAAVARIGDRHSGWPVHHRAHGYRQYYHGAGGLHSVYGYRYCRYPAG